MIDLFGIADDCLGDVNPMRSAILKASDGYDTLEDYTTCPRYIEAEVEIDVQALASSDISQIENISQQNDLRAVYVRGVKHALNRPLQLGGDVLVFDGTDWLVTQVLEEWGEEDWCKLLVTRQVPHDVDPSSSVPPVNS